MSPLVEIDNINKSFGGNVVLRSVSLDLHASDVVALVGGNGAGKSTLMKILTGIYTQDSGTIRVDGVSADLRTPAAAHAKGIYLVPQEPLLFPNMTVWENIALGFRDAGAALRQQAAELVEKLDWPLTFSRPANSLSIAEQQLVEIIRGLLRSARVLILDEPTSALTFAEIESLFKLIRELRGHGVGIFYITHRLTEVFEIATHAAILRDGKITLSGPVSDFTKETLLKGLLPEKTESGDRVIIRQPAASEPRAQASGAGKKPAFSLSGVGGDGFRGIDLEVYPGEVLGIAGVVGTGRTELAEAVFGIGQLTDGRVTLGDQDITKCLPSDAIRMGLNYVPEDRRLNGVFGIANTRANITSAILKRLSRFFLSPLAERRLAEKFINTFRIAVTGQDQLLNSLSGGNQQKVVLSRILSTNPKVVILDEPTRGVDASARGDVYGIIGELKREGLAVVLISSDMEEIVALSDRVVVMYNGSINRVFEGSDIALDGLMAAAFGVH